MLAQFPVAADRCPTELTLKDQMLAQVKAAARVKLKSSQVQAETARVRKDHASSKMKHTLTKELEATASVLKSSQSQLADTKHKLEMAEGDAEVTATVMAMQHNQISVARSGECLLDAIAFKFCYCVCSHGSPVCLNLAWLKPIHMNCHN